MMSSSGVPKSTSSIKIAHVKKGRRLYGGIHTVVASGQRCYLAYRRQAEIFRHGEKSISDAVRAGKAAWALDDATVLEMRAKGITLIGVYVRDTGDIYLTHIKNFFDREKTKLLNYEARGGALQRYLPLQFFKVRFGRVKIKAR
jgi:hypothetical protein